MINYGLLSGDVYYRRINYTPRTCFIMTQLEKPMSAQAKNIRKRLSRILKGRDFKTIEAGSYVKGRDFLSRKWGMMLAVPLGVAIITADMKARTLENIFYEVGLMQAIGKETLVIKTQVAEVPSAFVRTEYVTYGKGFSNNIDRFLDRVLEQAEHYATMAAETKGLIAIDYLRRAYLITGNQRYKTMAGDLSARLDEQSRNLTMDFLES